MPSVLFPALEPAMCPDKPSSKKSQSPRSSSRKKAAGDVASKRTKKVASKKSTSKAPAKKPQPLTLKPDEMPADVLEFIQAIDDYKRLEGRPFPTWSEILDIVKGLGYERNVS